MTTSASAEQIGVTGCAPTLVERRKTATRHDIADAAAQLFEVRGYTATTVEDIAAAAGISPRTFYRYFPGKDAVMLDIGSTRMQSIVSLLAERPVGEDIRLAVRNALRAQLATLTASSLFARNFWLVRGEPDLYAQLLREMWLVQRALAPVIAERTGRPESSPCVRMHAAMMMTAFVTASELWLEGDCTATPEQRLDEVLACAYGGLA